MSIRYAILGFLQWKPLTGYDLKKIIAEPGPLYWSGNNNQIYRTLMQLQEEGCVTHEVHHQEHLPSRKVYTITESGAEELRTWVLSAPELPQFHHSFLIQLAWADQLSHDELDALLARYEHDVEMVLLVYHEQTRRGTPHPERSERESWLWRKIAENYTSAFETELRWVREMRSELLERRKAEEEME